MVPVSLGQTCQVRFQLLRWLYAKRFPKRSLDDFRRDLFARSPDAHVLPRYPFDWQITPPDTLCEWLERDFRGVFELSDLVMTPEGVRNTRFPAVFPHHFHGDDIAAEYPTVRAKVEAQAERFRQLAQAEPFFILYAPKLETGTLLRITKALRKYSRCPVHLRLAPSIPSDKPDGRDWEGDDSSWSRFLDHHAGATEALPSA